MAPSFFLPSKPNKYHMVNYSRILLKLSGESLMGKQSHGIDSAHLQSYIEQIIAVRKTGVQIGIVIGGGNIFRG